MSTLPEIYLSVNTSVTIQNPESTRKAIARILKPLKCATFQRTIIILTEINNAIVTGRAMPMNQFTGGENRLNRSSIASTVISNPGTIMKYFLNASSIKEMQIHTANIDVSAYSDQERPL
jgi:hypothetical protein